MPMAVNCFAPAGTRLIVAAATTARIQLPLSPLPQLMITSTGTGVAYVEFGDVTVVATTPTGSTTGSTPVNPGTAPIFTRPAGATYMAVISAGTPTICVTVGAGD